MQNQAYLSVTTESQLDDYCQQILANPAITWLAIDTEFVRVDTFFPELSLVQIQTCLGETAIIDPLAIFDSSQSDKPLNSLVKLLASCNIVKVFHSARQDIEVLYQLEGVMPQAIFDTQIASVFKKHGELAGFARVIQAELNVELAKSQTRTNWHARPLSEEQIEYALDDVRYLAPLYEKYLDELSQPQLDAVYEDCELLLDESLYKPDPHSAGSRIKNLKGLRPKNRAIVNTLAEWRETYAIENNQPKKWVMSDDVIVHIAKRPPKTVEALYKVPGIKSSSVKDYGSIWIELIDEVFSLDPENFPKPEPKEKKTDADEDRLISYLQSYINQVADDFNLNVNQLISKRQLLALVRREESLTGWRKLMIGEQIQQLLDGQACLKVENQQIKLIQNS